MITPMKHVTLLCREDDTAEFLEALRACGAVHLNVTRQLNHDLEREEEALQHAEQVIRKLQTLPLDEGALDAGGSEEMSPGEIVEEILCREAELRDIQGVDAKLLKEQKRWAPFGDLSGATLRGLRDGGVSVGFYRAPGGTPELPPGVTWIPASEGFGLLLGLGELPEIEAERLWMPIRSPAVVQGRRTHLADLTARHKQAIARHTASLPALELYREEMADVLAYRRAHLGMARAEGLAWLTGFVPEDQEEVMRELASAQGAGFLSRVPVPEDPVPTLLKQNRVVSWIQPVFTFLGVTPGYHEVDVGWSFLIFLSLFSGMIIGDAGYGVLLMAVVGVLNLLKPSTRGKFANLLYLMGGATVLWGGLTGNVFGMERLPVWMEAVKIDALADMSDPKPVMNVCFVLGAAHLTLAHLWNLWRNRRSTRALAEIGWIGSTWTMYCLAGWMVLGWEALPAFTTPLFLVSAALVVVFMTPLKDFKAQWVDHMMLPLTFVNNFVDVVSYVRLYAVGMATFALASSFNTMILGDAGERGLVVTGIMLVILVLGHALNFILAGMGVMVHGIRLNTLEFASHLGLTWSGIPYHPFRRLSRSNPEAEAPSISNP